MNLVAEAKTFEILLVEDSPIDIKLTQEVLQVGDIKNNLHVVNDGEDAMLFLRRSDQYASAPRPDIILLDLNLARKDGREVLAEIKIDPRLRSIPIIILTSSRAERDIAKTYDLQANCYVVKPVDTILYLDLIKSLTDFWLKVVALPPVPAA